MMERMSTLSDRPRFERVHTDYNGRLGVPVGVFVAVDHLRRAGRLTADDEALWLAIDDWFVAHLPEPPHYADGNTTGVITWFNPRCRHRCNGAWTSRRDC